MTKTDKRTRRGAALIIAIAIMTVLLAIGLTFFTVARVESVTATNVVNTVRAEHLVDAGFAMAEYQLNRDLQMHPQATSLDHGWRTLFNGAAFAGKTWANSTGVPAFNMEPIEQKLRAAGVLPSTSLLYVKFTAANGGEYIEPLFRGPRTAPWLAIPRWQGNDILIYPRPEDGTVDLCGADGSVLDKTALNAAITPNAIVRFDDDPTSNFYNAGMYPFVTTNFYGQISRHDKNGNYVDSPTLLGLESLWMPEQVNRWADVDTNGDGMRDSIWVPLPKDVDLSYDGVDNDLDGVPDPESFDKQANQIVVDEEGNPRRDFEIGSFVYRIDDNTGRIVRAGTDITGPTSLRLTIPLPGLRLPVDMNNDGKIDMGDCYTNGTLDPNGSPVYVILPDTLNVPTAGGGSTTLNISAVDSLDNDYDQFVNGFSAYVFLGDPANTGHNDVAAAADRKTVEGIVGAPVLPDYVNARTRFANKVINWPIVMPTPWRAGDKTITLSPNAPAWLSGAAVPPIVISLTGEPVCDIVGRAAIHVVDESSKVNMNAAGGHIYRDDLDKTIPTVGEHIARAFNEGASTFEYETRALPGVGVEAAADFWGILAGAGYMTKTDGSRWDYGALSVDPAKAISVAIPYAPLQPYAYDISLPGYGRVDDNMNSLLLAFNGRADAGNQYPDQGLWVPPLGPLASAVLDGTLTLPASWQDDTPQQAMARREVQGNPFLNGPDITVPYAEVARQVVRPSFKSYYNRLGMFEGIDDPAEIQPAAPLRNAIAEADSVPNTANGIAGDNNNDGVANEIGELGDRQLANNYELLKAVDASGQIFGDLTWPNVKNVVTANSDSRNVNYVETASGLKSANKIDPNLATPAQLAAGLIIKGEDIKPVTDQYVGSGTSHKISLPKNASATQDDPLDFAEGLRQADTTLTGYLFDQINGLFTADPELQAMQTAVNIADSRDADCARSLLVMDKKVTDACKSYYERQNELYPSAPFALPFNRPTEPLNERERVPQSDSFPVGELEDFLVSAIDTVGAVRRVIAVDKWWQLLTDAVDTSVTTDREDRAISYAAAGVDAIRINEMMVRPVRRVEAEAVTHLHYNVTTHKVDSTAPRMTLSQVRADGPDGVRIAGNYANLNPTPPGYEGMPTFDVEAIPTLDFDATVGAAWNVQSYYDYTHIPAAPNRLILGDETAYRFDSSATPTWTAGGTDPLNDINNDIVEFRVKASDGLPPGRYYLTVNVVDPVTGDMTVGAKDQLEYSFKYINSDPTLVPRQQGITEDVQFLQSILNISGASAPPLVQRGQLVIDYFTSFWQSVDDLAYIATQTKVESGSAEPMGWVFCRSELRASTIDFTQYVDVRNYLGFDPLDSTGTTYLLNNRFIGYTQSYFRDGVRGDAADQPIPATTRTFTVYVPPMPVAGDPNGSQYDTLCIAFRVKPMAQNLDSVTGRPRKLAINFLDFSQQPDHEYVELVNTTDKAIDLGGRINPVTGKDDLSGWTLEVGIPDPAGIDDDPSMRDPFKSRWTIPAGTVIAPKGYLLLGFDKFDQFRAGTSTTPSIYANGMGLAAGTANPVDSTVPVPERAYVTEPPIAGTTTNAASNSYGVLSDATASVFRRNAPPTTLGAGIVDTDYADYIDNDGDGVSSGPFVYGSGSGGGAVVPDSNQDTDGVAVEAKYHGNDAGVVPPFARIVQLEPRELWWDNPYKPNSKMVGMNDINSTAGIAELVLRGGILPDYPEHDGHDNDGDGGYVTQTTTTGGTSGTSTTILHYVRGTLDKDMVDNNLDGYIDECGMERMIQDPLHSGVYISQNATPFDSEGVDEGRIGLVNFLPKSRPRMYGYGSFEEGDLPLVFTPSVVAYREWGKALREGLVGNEYNLNRPGATVDEAFWAQYMPGIGLPCFVNFPSGQKGSVLPFVSLAEFGVYVTPPTGISPVLISETSTGSVSSPEWKSFVERRWNPGDNVVVTLYVGPSSRRKVADRVTYRELDVTNRAVDDIQTSPYYVDGYRNFTYDTTATPYARWDGADGDMVAGVVCLDRNRPQYWLPNQMGLDFYRSLERKHPLYPGDKYGTSNRWEATDGSYDDWSDSLSVFEAVEDRQQSYDPAVPSSNHRTSGIVGRFDTTNGVPGNTRLFHHAIWGSPLRMNTQQRLWDNPPDLAALLSSTLNLGMEGLAAATTGTIPLDDSRRRQFVESDSLKTDTGASTVPFEDLAYSLRRAEVRNRPFNSVADLMKLPMLAFNVPLNTGCSDNNNNYVWRSVNAGLNTRWNPVEATPVPLNLPYWRQDTTLAQSVLATSPDTSASGVGYAALTELTDINPITLSVGQARFRPILSTPSDATVETTAASYLHWTVNSSVVRAPHGWAPVMLFADYPTKTPAWSTLPRWTFVYPPALPVGEASGTKVTWGRPVQWYQWGTDNVSVDAPYLVQAEFLFDGNHRTPVFGGLQPGDVGSRWPAARLIPSNASATVPLENVEYPRAVMYVSQHNADMGENNRAEGIFSWDANAGLENGTYIAYVATFVPRMGQSLGEANHRVLESIVGGTAPGGGAPFNEPVLPPADPTVTPTLTNIDSNIEPIAAKLCSLDPAQAHGPNEDRFEPALALDFITDPAVADRVAPPRSVYTPPNPPGRPLAALPHPADWFPNSTTTGDTVQTAAAYHADGDGMILYSGSGQVTWRARLVRVTDRFLALRVRNLGRPDQVACITGVVLAPARHVAGKINVNTVENERTIAGESASATNYTFGVFNTLLGLPGVVDALKIMRDPSVPDTDKSMGGFIPPESDIGWPVQFVSKTGITDPKSVPWPSPELLTGVDKPNEITGLVMPPQSPRTQPFNDISQEPNLLADKNRTGDDTWSALSDGLAAMRLSSMVMTGRTEHYDGRYYENLGGLAGGLGKGGRIRKALDGGTMSKERPYYPLSNENLPERRFDEIDQRFGRMANLITMRSDVFEILVTVQAGTGTDTNGDNRIDYRNPAEFTVSAESQGRVIYERRARNDRSDEAAK